MDSSSRALLAVPAGFVLAALSLLLIFAGAAGGAAAAVPPGCGPAGTATTVAGIDLTAEQMGNAQTIAAVTASRGLTSYAGVIAEATAYQESRLINLDHGDTAGPDSRGLFQQRPSQGWGTQAQVLDPTYATNAFLNALVRVPNWQTIPLTVAAQTVQISAYPDAYAQWQTLGEALIGLLWPGAAAGGGDQHPHLAAAAATSGTTAVVPTPPAPTSTAVQALCPGGGGDGPVGTGTSSTTLPNGFTITGTPAGTKAVQYALAQLGKPYVWAGAGPDSYDCSGLTMASWATAGVTLAHSTAVQVNAGTPEPTDLSQAQAGDLVFIPGSDGTPTDPRHVGMVAGTVTDAAGVHLYLIQAPHTGADVELTEATAWSARIVDVRHIG